MDENAILAALSRLEAGQASVESRLTSVEAGQTRLRVDLMERMDRMENKMTALRDDMVVNLGSNDAVKRANENTRESLRALEDVVSVIHRKVMRLETQVQNLEEK
jgi:acetyl-CoA carboxylase alpha subunit